jgi:predicted nucleotidyltransferase
MKDITKTLCFLPFVEAIALFGSRARGDNAERSDIDIATYCTTVSEKDGLETLKIINKADTLLKIDCIRFDTLPKSDPLKAAIETETKTLYSKRSLTKKQ